MPNGTYFLKAVLHSPETGKILNGKKPLAYEYSSLYRECVFSNYIWRVTK